MRILWTPGSTNTKTGDVPTAWIGADKEETRASCSGCKLAPREGGGDGSCYAWSGTPTIARASIQKSAAAGANRSLDRALVSRAWSARMVRVSALGDVGRSGRAIADEIVEKVRAAGLALVGYTHHWREAEVSEAWRGRLMASVETLAQADEAHAQGWRAAVVVPADYPRVGTTPAGRRVVVCPAQVAEERAQRRDPYDYNGGNSGRPVTCNDCRLCDGSKGGPVIAFREHGNGAAKLARERAAALVAAERERQSIRATIRELLKNNA